MLRDVTPQTGVSFRHDDGSRGGQYHIVEYVSAGLALFDYDGDGWIDLYFLNGAPLTRPPGKVLPSDADSIAIYGDWHVCGRHAASGSGQAAARLGGRRGRLRQRRRSGPVRQQLRARMCCTAIDGDGTLCRRDATGGRRERAIASGRPSAFLDTDADGDARLCSWRTTCSSRWTSTAERRCGGSPRIRRPLAYAAGHEHVLSQQRRRYVYGRQRQSGIGAHGGTGMGAICADFDNDGDTDIFVCNDVTPNFLFQNDGTGKFEEVALFRGTAFDATGQAQGSMGVDCGDYDNDGWLDFMQTCFQDEIPVLYRNSGQGYFDDVSRLTGAGTTAVPHGHVGRGTRGLRQRWRPRYLPGDRPPGRQRRRSRTTRSTTRLRTFCCSMTGDGKFADVSAHSGDGMLVKRCSRGRGLRRPG